MIRFSDFFKDLKERSTSPIFTSFIISWLVVNWRLPVGLFFYKTIDLKLDGYKSFIDLFERNLTFQNAFLFPLLACISYVLVYPLIKNLLLAFEAWVKRWGGKLVSRVSKSAVIPMDKYIELRKIYAERTSLLQSVIDKESETINLNEQLRNDNIAITNVRNDFQQKLQAEYSKTDLQLLRGTWEISFPVESEKQAPKRVMIENNSFNFQDPPFYDMAKNNTIRNFFYNDGSKSITFFVESTILNDNHYKFFTLDVLDSGKFLQGIENGKRQIRFERRF